MHTNKFVAEFALYFLYKFESFGTAAEIVLHGPNYFVTVAENSKTEPEFF
jgi:hypothetical protein